MVRCEREAGARPFWLGPLFLFLSFVPAFSFSQTYPVLTWQHFFDNKGQDHAARMARTPGGLIWLGSYTEFPNAVPACSNIWMMQCNPQGEVLREKEIDLDGCETLSDLAIGPDGSIAFAATTNTLVHATETGDPTYGANFLYGLLDPDGALVWMESAGGSRLDAAHAIAINPFNEIWVGGLSHSIWGDRRSAGGSDQALLKSSLGGELIRMQAFGSKSDEWITALTALPNGDLLACGMTGDQPDAAFGSGWVARISASGVPLWSVTLPSELGGQLLDLTTDDAGRVLAAGNRFSPDNGLDFWYVLLDPGGKVLAQSVLSGPDTETLTSATACSDGGFLLGGWSKARQSNGTINDEDFWVMRLDPMGGMLWKQRFGGTDSERCTDVMEYEPGVYYAYGQKYNRFTRDSTHANQDLWLIRLEEYPCDSIQAGIFVRADDYKTTKGKPTRFRARHNHGTRFLWDFGDGTTSTEEQPLKVYDLYGAYEVRLTVFVNENCWQTVKLPRLLEVW